jgi:hypothetical protein
MKLLAPLFGVIAAVWLLRLLAASISGIPVWIVQALSISVFVPICIILATLLIHTKRFGGYTNVVLSVFLLVSWGQLLIVGAIAFSVMTGIQNIYSAPEYSVPGDTNHTRHIVGHLTMGIGLEALIGALMGCVILYMLRRANRDDGD